MKLYRTVFSTYFCPLAAATPEFFLWGSINVSFSFLFFSSFSFYIFLSSLCLPVFFLLSVLIALLFFSL